MFKTVLLISLSMVASTANASSNFKCIVNDAYELNKKGKLENGNDLTKSKIGKEFIVNRQSGQITGGGFVNTMSGQMPSVYKPEDTPVPSENNYKAITIYKPHFTVDYLEINEQIEGKEKPFIYKGAWGTIVTGICVYQ